MKSMKCFTAILLLTLLIMSLNTVSATLAGYSLVFDPANYTSGTLTVDSRTISYRAYEKIVYVKNPVDTNYQIMNIYVPEEYYQSGSIGNYTAATAPIFFPNSCGGYTAASPRSPSATNAAGLALSKGYVVATPGLRGRTTQNSSGEYTGKAPASIVDLKAAVRYLRYNDANLPGDAEKIISSGTSAGGALSALLGATGNNPDYAPYLEALGAADASDAIYAASCYCPITNLDNADTAYEWMFGSITGSMSSTQKTYSSNLKALFPSYLNGLGLTTTELGALTLDSDGAGTFKTYVKSLVIAAAQTAYDSGASLASYAWVTISNGTVTDIDFDKYVAYATRKKSPPAFDALDLSSAENSLFGTATINSQHFTDFGETYNTDGSASRADSSIVKMMNPMNYISVAGTTTAPYWRIRHGAVDSDTALAIPAILAAKLKNNGCAVDFAVPWGQGHGGDYDLEELFAWMEEILSNPTPTITSSPGTATATPVETVTPAQTATPVATVTPHSTTGSISVTYSQYDWGSGATVSVTIKNNGAATVNGWNLVFDFTGDQQITNLWSANFTQNGTTVTVSNADYNSTIPANASVSFGFNIAYSGSNALPTSFTLNGTSCQVE